jgi:hypothetical protein
MKKEPFSSISTGRQIFPLDRVMGSPKSSYISISVSTATDVITSPLG